MKNQDYYRNAIATNPQQSRVIHDFINTGAKKWEKSAAVGESGKTPPKRHKKAAVSAAAIKTKNRNISLFFITTSAYLW